jgi:hypothetical protein
MVACQLSVYLIAIGYWSYRAVLTALGSSAGQLYLPSSTAATWIFFYFFTITNKQTDKDIRTSTAINGHLAVEVLPKFCLKSPQGPGRNVSMQSFTMVNRYYGEPI